MTDSLATPPAAAPQGDTPEPYDPADYRWVPVRRVPRYDGWTEEKQRRFIEALADTGQVRLAAEAVGMTRETAYRLRRSPQGAAFARAWDAARLHAGSLLEDVAFERAIEGVEHDVFDADGEVIATKRVVNDRLLMFLLRHLKPDRYAADALARPETRAEPVTVEASLRAMEPQLPAPPEQLLDAATLENEFDIAEAADGVLPSFLTEQRRPKSPAQRQTEERAAREARGEAACAKMEANQPLSPQEFRDMRFHLDPLGKPESRRRYR